MMFLSNSHVLLLLSQYKYILIFPIMVFEGPIITVISGFLVHGGVLSAYVAYPLLVLGSFIGDILHFLLGKYIKKSNFLKKVDLFLGYTEEKEKKLEGHFTKHTGKTLLVAKASHGVGGVVQIAAGVANVSFFDFIVYSFIGTIPKTLVLFLLGYYLGSSYEKIDKYFDTVAYVTISIVVLIFLYLVGKAVVSNFVLKGKVSGKK